jgi:ABC-2 type transport system ATP-binding protein
MTNTPVITAKNLTMRYGAYTALDHVSFDVAQGEILGLLGPNGAGKTTLMRLLTTYLYPTDGSASIAGFDVVQRPVNARAHIGYLPETAPLYGQMRVDEYLTFIARAHGLAPQQVTARLQWAKETCGLKAVWQHALHELSKGYRQRVGLAQALLHDPDVLILDEPTPGLDPLQILDIRQLIRRLAAQKTIIFSTHILQEVEALADRIVIINQGQKVADGTQAEIAKRALTVQRVRVAVQAEEHAVHEALQGLNMCQEIRHEGSPSTGTHQFMLRAEVGAPLIRAVDDLVKSRGWPLVCLAEDSASLEEAFLALLKRSTQQGRQPS